MKVPETNFCCKFLYQQYKLKQRIKLVNFIEEGAITEDGEIISWNDVPKLHRARSIAEVPYWRLYVIKFEKQTVQYGFTRYKRTVIHKTMCNYDFVNICDLMRKLGDPNDRYTSQPGVRYSYECWPRRTMFNKT